MSTTDIFVIGGSNPREVGSVRNSWRGAMYVWNDVAKRHCGMPGGFPLSSQDESAWKVWQAFKLPSVPTHEKIVLLSTLDNAVVLPPGVDAVIDAFEQYGREHPNSSLTEQAAILRQNSLQPDEAFAWLQTSVSEFWGRWEGDEEVIWYDLSTGQKHFDLTVELRKVSP